MAPTTKKRKGGATGAQRGGTGTGRVAQKLLAARGGGAGAGINPFDAVGNKKAKFEVLNKRAKGQVRNVAKARQLATERRRKTLLVEYQASKKDNVFRDRRFGEGDPTLSLEEKMLMRFQKERQRRARASGGGGKAGRFNLEGGSDEEYEEDEEYGGLRLTHKGRALGADDYKDQDLGSSDEDEDALGGGLGKEIVKELHFGGGGGGGAMGVLGRKRALPAGEGEEEEGTQGGQQKKTRAELLEEIIAKSKLHKAVKARQKDAQEAALTRLDDTFLELVGDLEFRDKWKEKEKEKERAAKAEAAAQGAKASKEGEGKKSGGGLLLDDADDYEALMAEVREERFAAKAQDRTKTPEEVAREERERLEKLEKARLARMRGEVDAEIRGDEGDDGSDGSDESVGEEEGGGDALGLGELGRGWDASSDDEDDSGSDSGSSGSESHESESESSGEEDEEEEEEDEPGSESGSDESDASSSSARPPSSKQKTKKGEKGQQSQPAEQGRPVGRAGREKAAVAKALAATPAAGINPDMPYVLECPTTLERYGEMVREYARGPQDVAEMVGRIRRYHSLRGAGGSGGSNRAKVHNFYDVLMRRLRVLGDAVGRGQQGRQVEIDAVAEALRAMAHEMPVVAAALWGRMLTGLQAKLAKALRDHELGARGSCWPSLGACLLLRLLPQIWPATDFRHPVVTPALLFVGQALTQCPVTTGQDVERGLFLVALALECTEGAGRVMPEALAFLLAVLVALAPSEAAASASSVPLPTFALALVAALRAAAREGAEAEGKEEGPIVLGGVGKAGAGDEEEEENEDEEEQNEQAAEGVVTPAQARRCLAVACRLLQRFAAGASITQSPAAPELLAPFLAALARVDGVAGVGEAHAAVAAAVTKGREGRQPLAWRKKGLAVVASLAPRIIDNFVVRKDEGMDRERAKVKQLTRQVKREKKGAMRELRRDAAFLDAEKVKGEREREAERRRVVKENMAWLQEQQASINQQVKKTKGEALRGGGSGVKKGMLTR